MAAPSSREQVEGALRNLGFKPAQVRAGLAALASGDARPIADQLRDAIGHVDDSPKAEPPKAEPPPKPKPPESGFADVSDAELAKMRAAKARAMDAKPDPLARFGSRKPSKALPPPLPSRHGYMRRANAHLAELDRERAAKARRPPGPSWGRLALVGAAIGAPIAALLIFGRERSRDGGTAPTKPSAPGTGLPATPATGKAIKVTLPRGSKKINANLHSAPGLSSAVVAGVKPGTEATITEGPQQASGAPWYRIATTSATGAPVAGWMHGSLLPGAA